MAEDALPLPDALLVSLIGLLVIASGATLITLLVRRMQGQPLLRWEPRRPVPWGVAGAVLAGAMSALALAALFLKQDTPDAPELSSFEFALRMVHASLQILLLTGIATVAIALATRASQTDLGLPQYADQLAADLRIGATVWLVALLPVYGLQALLVQILAEPDEHPLIKQLTESPSPALLVTGFVSAVVVAPICEEIAYRLLLQGWLEKREDAYLGRSVAGQPSGPLPDRATDEVVPVQTVEPVATVPPELPARSLAALPRGWWPILISSVLFAAAHIGHGPAPVPLFFLALMLGYAYQRTHRIVPCIVAHALFNATSLIALGLMLRNRMPPL